MNPRLSHNLSDLTSRPPGPETAAAFSQLRTSLIKVLRNSPESREPICDALELIETLQQQVEAKRNPDAEQPAATPRGSRESGGSQEYVVQSTLEGPFLTERRPSGSQPFRCPKPVYDAAARILADAAQPMHFEEVMERLNAATGERQADYRLRVCLRFWLAHRAVQRFRTRYRVADSEKFTERAEQLWTDAAGAD